MSGSSEIPTYEYFEQSQRFQISRSYGDIAQSHEKQVSCASQQTMVVLPDSNFQSGKLSKIFEVI